MSHLNINIQGRNTLPWGQGAGGPLILTLAANVHGQALFIDDAFNLKPGYISDWRWNYREKYYEITIQEGLTFHDGKPFTAKEFEFVLLKSLFSPTIMPLRNIMLAIKGADKIKPGQPYQAGLVEGLKVTGTYTANLALETPNPAFLYSLSRPVPKVVAQDDVGPDLMSPKQDIPNGIGDYRVKSVDHKQAAVTLTKHKPEIPGPDTVVITSRPSMDGADVALSSVNETYDPAVYQETESYFSALSGFLEFNKFCQETANPDFRAMITKAFDRLALAGLPEFRGFTQPQFEYLPERFWGRSHLPNPYDLEGAKALFKKLPKAVQEKEYTVAFYNYSSIPSFKEWLIHSLREIGLNVKAKVVAFSSLDATTTDVLGVTGAEPVDFRDSVALFSSFMPGSSITHQHHDEQLVALYKDAAQAEALDQRMEKVSKLGTYLVETQKYIVPLLSSKMRIYYKKDKVAAIGNQTNISSLIFREIKLK